MSEAFFIVVVVTQHGVVPTRNLHDEPGGSIEDRTTPDGQVAASRVGRPGKYIAFPSESSRLWQGNGVCSALKLKNCGCQAIATCGCRAVRMWQPHAHQAIRGGPRGHSSPHFLKNLPQSLHNLHILTLQEVGYTGGGRASTFQPGKALGTNV
jgi:hypothetical protein